MYIINGWYNRPNRSHKTKHGSKYLESQNHIKNQIKKNLLVCICCLPYHCKKEAPYGDSERQAWWMAERKWLVSEDRLWQRNSAANIFQHNCSILQMNWTNTMNEMTWDTHFPWLCIHDLNIQQSCKCTIQATSYTQEKDLYHCLYKFKWKGQDIHLRQLDW